MVQWAARGDDAETAAETRKRARSDGPDSVAFLHYRGEDGRVRVLRAARALAIVLLEVGEFLMPSRPRRPACSARRTTPTAPTGAKRVNGKPWRGERSGSDRWRLSPPRPMDGPCRLVLAAFDPVCGFGDERPDAQAAWRAPRPAGQLDRVQEEIITIEMKSRAGRCSAAQRAVREALIRAGGLWWQCITARSAMWALRRSGVRFRQLVHADGRTERWRQPRLVQWEVPRRDPSERRPNAPEVVAERRAASRRRRARRLAAVRAAAE